MSNNTLNGNGIPEWLRGLGLVIGTVVTIATLVSAIVIAFTSLSGQVSTLTTRVDLQNEATTKRLDKLETKMDEAIRGSSDYAGERARIEAVISAKVKPEALR